MMIYRLFCSARPIRELYTNMSKLKRTTKAHPYCFVGYPFCYFFTCVFILSNATRKLLTVPFSAFSSLSRASVMDKDGTVGRQMPIQRPSRNGR